jgi:hypothetical protein
MARVVWVGWSRSPNEYFLSPSGRWSKLGPYLVPKFFGPNPKFFAFWHSGTK